MKKSTDVFQNPAGHFHCYQQLGRVLHGNITADSNTEEKEELGSGLSCQHSSKKCCFNKHKCRCYFWAEKNPSPPILHVLLEFSTISPITNDVICSWDFLLLSQYSQPWGFREKKKKELQVSMPLTPRPPCLTAVTWSPHVVEGPQPTVGPPPPRAVEVLESGSDWEAREGEPVAHAL